MKQKTYRTKDLGFAGVLFLSTKFLGVERGKGQKVYFLFEDDEGREELSEAYWSNELKVPPRAYFQAIKELKGHIYRED